MVKSSLLIAQWLTIPTHTCVCTHIQSLIVFRGQTGFDRDNTNDPSKEKKANNSPMVYNLQGHPSYNGANIAYYYAKQCYFLAFVPLSLKLYFFEPAKNKKWPITKPYSS